MDKLFVDTNIFIRYLTNDDPKKAHRVENLLKLSIEGKLTLVTNLMVIAELVWSLESYYSLAKSEVTEKLSLILNTPNLEVVETEPVNNFWTLPVKNYCSFFLSLHTSAGGLIHAASGKAGGSGAPFTNRSGWASKAT